MLVFLVLVLSIPARIAQPAMWSVLINVNN